MRSVPRQKAVNMSQQEVVLATITTVSAERRPFNFDAMGLLILNSDQPHDASYSGLSAARYRPIHFDADSGEVSFGDVFEAHGHDAPKIEEFDVDQVVLIQEQEGGVVWAPLSENNELADELEDVFGGIIQMVCGG